MRYTGPVSYTHLDVYKRQVVTGCLSPTRGNLGKGGHQNNNCKKGAYMNAVEEYELSLIHI